jgi:DNA processing protein
LEASGRTVAVFGCGIDVIYPPEHLDLYRRIVETGAVVSEFPFGRRADRQTFPMRNRVVAGMCAGVVVVESSAVGGSMITSRFAGEQGRQVFAVPGRADQPTAVGCHKLIRDGATLVTHAEQVIEEIAPSLGLSWASSVSAGDSDASSGKAVPDDLSSAESTVYACLNDGSILTSDSLCERTNLPVHEVAAALTMLELKRLVSRCPDGSFEVR